MYIKFLPIESKEKNEEKFKVILILLNQFVSQYLYQNLSVLYFINIFENIFISLLIT